jgi:ABC-type glycerol-3-phosphate transport system substrate-binding protein
MTTVQPVTRVTRRTVVGTGAGGLASLLAACAGPGAGDGAGGGKPEIQPAEIRMYEWSGAADLESAKAIAEAYQQQQSKVKVNVEQPPSGDYYENLLAFFVAGGAADVINTQS